MSISQVKNGNASNGEATDLVRPVHVVVDLEGGYRMRMFLKALDESVLVKKDYNYVFANLVGINNTLLLFGRKKVQEMEDADLASFHYSLINITGFQMFDRNDKKFQHNRKAFQDTYQERYSTVDYLPASSAFAHDALLVAGAALDLTLRKHGVSVFTQSFARHQLFNRGLPGLYCRPHEDRSYPDRQFEPFEFGDIIAESLKEVVLTRDEGTLTGHIQFDPHTGWRTNFSATVIEIKPGVNSWNSIKERFQWVQGKGFLLGEQIVYHEFKPNKTAIQKGILVDKPWKLRLSVVTVLVSNFLCHQTFGPTNSTVITSSHS
ncbi:unnamed protein product [Nippostrongylus brasiliensis]|uniref:ANF_receptor domain-containing protein n=1 Tax=Nippostrongylus brasiliensis TaxID=27835 RepID=A0A0N4XMK0_NIPBR|nr:unnamed protein product [Nippostrongylus brasiliensis]